MKFAGYLFAPTLLLMPIGPSYGAGLDDFGGIEGSTVRTEIHRGVLASDDCGNKTATDNLALADCIYKAHTDNVRERTATLAFTLGLFFDAWLKAARSPDVKNRHSSAGVARDFFFYAEQHRRRLRLNHTEVCEAAQHSCNEAERIWTEWEAKALQPRH